MKSLFLALSLSLLTAAFAIQEAQKQEAPISNKIKWRTASEENNFGFNVHRSEHEDGPFVKLNQSPIEGGGTTDTPRDYLYEDKSINPGKGYYYFVESIALDGTRERFTPVIYAKPKQPDA